MINVTIDRANTVSLKSHADPTFQGNVTCVNRGVDLTIKQAQLNGVDLSSPDVKSACIAGAKNLVHVVVSNLGDKDPSDFDTGLLVDGKLVAHRVCGRSLPAQRQRFVLRGDVKHPGRNHQIQVVVDQDHKVTEASDDNNTSPSARR